jgi:hypothetical protein
VPRKIELGKPAKFNFDLAAPAGGWKHDARVRIQADKPLGDDEWTATFNGEAIAASRRCLRTLCGALSIHDRET